MKYKILVSGKPAIAIDFMSHTLEYFTCLSTTSYIRDITNHFKLFEPDAYTIFADDTSSDLASNINSLKDYPSFNSTPIIIVASSDICDNLQTQNPYLAQLYIKRPISADNLALRITRYLEKVEEEKKNAAEAPENIPESTPENTPTDTAQTENVRKHLLIVDDDRSILKMLKTALIDKYDVTTMINGILVEKFLESQNVDLIILDHEMPIETGADIFKKLKNHPKGKNIPVCFLTGVSDRSKIEEIMSLRPHGYLLKPINMDMLMATISNLTS